MKKLTKSALALALLLPALSFAAYNDVALQTGAVISVAGITINISGDNSVMETLVVNDSNFTVQMQLNSYIKITAPNRNKITYTADVTGKDNSTSVCDSVNSSLEITEIVASTSIKTITPSSTLCGSTSTAGGGGPISSGSGGGGGGGSYAPPVVVTASSSASASLSAQALQAQIDALKAKLGSLAGSKLTKNLKRGMTDAQIMTLQKFLNTDADTSVALSGPGSSGMETKLFGILTEKAVQKFQKKHGIVSSGTPASTGYGRVGPLTRAKINLLLVK